jgi:myo-inositol-1(or 4)-monophosphatase
MDEYLAFAKQLAREHGKLIATNFRKNLEVAFKSDNSPVTQVDKQINDAVRQAIISTYPNQGLLGEEANYGSGREEFQWLCDPLDGTKAFVMGVPTCVFMLALTTKGKLLLSVVYDPFEDKLYHALLGKGAFCNDARIHVNNQTMTGSYVLLDVTSAEFLKAVKQAGSTDVSVSGTGYKCMLLATGRCSGMIRGESDNHDIGPASLIVEEAGGKVSDFSGGGLSYNHPISEVVLSNGLIHDQLLKIISSV